MDLAAIAATDNEWVIVANDRNGLETFEIFNYER